MNTPNKKKNLNKREKKKQMMERMFPDFECLICKSEDYGCLCFKKKIDPILDKSWDKVIKCIVCSGAMHYMCMYYWSRGLWIKGEVPTCPGCRSLTLEVSNGRSVESFVNLHPIPERRHERQNEPELELPLIEPVRIHYSTDSTYQILFSDGSTSYHAKSYVRDNWEFLIKPWWDAKKKELRKFRFESKNLKYLLYFQQMLEKQILKMISLKNDLVLLLCGDIETNPGPESEKVKLLVELLLWLKDKYLNLNLENKVLKELHVGETVLLNVMRCSCKKVFIDIKEFNQHKKNMKKKEKKKRKKKPAYENFDTYNNLDGIVEAPLQDIEFDLEYFGETLPEPNSQTDEEIEDNQNSPEISQQPNSGNDEDIEHSQNFPEISQEPNNTDQPRVDLSGYFQMEIDDSSGTEEMSEDELDILFGVRTEEYSSQKNFKFKKGINFNKKVKETKRALDIRSDLKKQTKLKLVRKTAEKTGAVLNEIWGARLTYLLEELLNYKVVQSFLEEREKDVKIDIQVEYSKKFSQLYEDIELVLYKSVKLSSYDFQLIRSKLLFVEPDASTEPFVRKIDIPQKYGVDFGEKLLEYSNIIIETKGGAEAFGLKNLPKKLIKKFGANFTEQQTNFIQNKNYLDKIQNIYKTQNGTLRWNPKWDEMKVFDPNQDLLNHFDSFFLLKKAHGDFLKKKVSRSKIKPEFEGVDALNPAKLDNIINNKVVVEPPVDLILPPNSIYIGEQFYYENATYNLRSLKVVLANLVIKNKLESRQEVTFSLYGDGAVIIKNSFLFIGVRINESIEEDEEFEPLMIGFLDEKRNCVEEIFSLLIEEIRDCKNGLCFKDCTISFTLVFILGDNKFQQICICSKKGNSNLRCPRCDFNFNRFKKEDVEVISIKKKIKETENQEKLMCKECNTGVDQSKWKCKNCLFFFHSHCAKSAVKNVCEDCVSKQSCGICEKEDFEEDITDWIACSLCSQWFHEVCLITNELSYKIDGDFFCTRCQETEVVKKKAELDEMKKKIQIARKNILFSKGPNQKSLENWIMNSNNKEELSKLGFNTNENGPAIFGGSVPDSVDFLNKYGLDQVSLPPDNLHNFTGSVKLIVSFEKNFKMNKDMFKKNLKLFLKKSDENFLNGRNWRNFTLQFYEILIPCVAEDRKKKVTKLFSVLVELQFLCYARPSIRSTQTINRFKCLIQMFRYRLYRCYKTQVADMQECFSSVDFRTTSAERGEGGLAKIKPILKRNTNRKVFHPSALREVFVRMEFEKVLKRPRRESEKEMNNKFLVEFICGNHSKKIKEIKFSEKHLEVMKEQVDELFSTIPEDQITQSGLNTFEDIKEWYKNYLRINCT